MVVRYPQSPSFSDFILVWLFPSWGAEPFRILSGHFIIYRKQE